MISLILFYFLTFVSHANTYEAADISLERALEIANSSKDVESFVSQLPENYRRSHVLVHTSESSQGATAEEPRAIIFGKTARLLISVSALSKNVEIIAWDEKNKSFSAHSISFSNSRAIIDNNPTSCTACHGQPIRPKWDSYNFWPGVYCPLTRAEIGVHCKGSPIGENFKKYLASRESHKLYRHFPVLTDQEVKEKFKAVLRPQYASKVDTIEPCRNGIGVDGPSEMSEALTYLNAKRIFKRFSDAKTWPYFKFAFASTVLKCNVSASNGNEELAEKEFGNLFLYDTKARPLNKIHKETMDKFRKDQLERFNLIVKESPSKYCLNTIFEPLTYQFANTWDIMKISKLRLLARRMRVWDEDWSLERSSGKWDFTRAFEDLNILLASEMIDHIRAVRDPDLEFLNKIFKDKTEYSYGAVQKQKSYHSPDSVCEQLATKSKEALKIYHKQQQTNELSIQNGPRNQKDQISPTKSNGKASSKNVGE